jgi:hypothetical protein
MIQRFIAPVAALLMGGAPFASATTIHIDFEEFAYGTVVGNYYNGGKDSYNRASGSYYGVSFGGGSVKYTPRGAYLSSTGYRSLGMSLDPEVIRAILGTDQYYIGFNAGRYDIDGGPADVRYENSFVDSIWIAGNGNPNCGYLPGACDNPYYASMGGYSTFAGVDGAGVTSISFNADRIDNIWISSVPIRPSAIVGSYTTDRDIPEPASIALLGVGAAALLARRRSVRRA